MTGLLSGNELISLFQGLISAKKQQGAFSMDLTVRSISRITAGGSLDFGGGEYQEAATETLEPVKKTPEEPYGWWNLKAGKYLIRFNENIQPSEKAVIIILPHERLLAAGGSHSPVAVESVDEGLCVPLEVGEEGLAGIRCTTQFHRTQPGRTQFLEGILQQRAVEPRRACPAQQWHQAGFDLALQRRLAHYDHTCPWIVHQECCE